VYCCSRLQLEIHGSSPEQVPLPRATTARATASFVHLGQAYSAKSLAPCGLTAPGPWRCLRQPVGWLRRLHRTHSAQRTAVHATSLQPTPAAPRGRARSAALGPRCTAQRNPSGQGQLPTSRCSASAAHLMTCEIIIGIIRGHIWIAHCNASVTIAVQPVLIRRPGSRGVHTLYTAVGRCGAGGLNFTWSHWLRRLLWSW